MKRVYRNVHRHVRSPKIRIGCSFRIVFVLRKEHDCRLYAAKLRTCTSWWRTDDRRRIRRLSAFFSFAISVSISPCLSGSCDFSFSRSLSFSFSLSLNRHSPPWVMVCFRSVILSLIALLTTNARCRLLHGATPTPRLIYKDYRTLALIKKVLYSFFTHIILWEKIHIIIITPFYTHQIYLSS